MEIKIEKNRAVLLSRPVPKILAILPQLEGPRRWLKGGGMSFEPTPHNMEALKSIGAFAREEKIEESQEAFDADLEKKNYVKKTEPFKHQEEAERRMQNMHAFALFMEMGTGKSKVALDEVGRRFCEGWIDAAIIVSKNGVHKQWVDEQIPEHLGAEFRAIAWDKKKLPEYIFDNSREKLTIFSLNYEALISKSGWEETLKFARAYQGRVAIIADESHKFKNHNSRTHSRMIELNREARPKFKAILTGSPIAKDLVDEWSQLLWLDPNILGMAYVTTFRNEYCIMGGFNGRSVIGAKNIDKFKEKTSPYCFRATKEELDIPPKVFKRWRYDLSDSQKSMIKDLKEQLSIKIQSGEISSAANAAVLLIRVQQITNGFIVDDNGSTSLLYDQGANPRIAALWDHLSEEEEDEQCIIWARFRKDIDLIQEMLEEKGASWTSYRGGMKEADRKISKDKFLKGDVQFFLSNPQTGGTGLNLQVGGCRRAVYYSNGFNAIERWQSEDRINRIGTKDFSVYTDIVAKGGIDLKVLANLRKKKGLSDLVLDDVVGLFDD